jgi:hypothetical protein
MDADRFDALSRALTTAGSRRTTLGSLLGTLLGGALPGRSPESLAAAGKGKRKTKHDHSSRGVSSKGRRTHLGLDRRKAHTQDVTDEQPTQRTKAAQLESGEVRASDVSAAACLPPGAKPCRKGSQCCSGRCKRKKKKCLACPTGTEYCASLQACVDPSQYETDAANCGFCGNDCGDDACENGECTGGGLTCSPCQGDKVCNTSTGFCTCPADKPVQCEFNSTRCSADPNTDSERCGLNCYDCEVSFAAGYHCCNGQCVNGCGPNTDGSCTSDPCGPSCTPCPTGQFCCNLGPGTTGQCVDPHPVSHKCPPP